MMVLEKDIFEVQYMQSDDHGFLNWCRNLRFYVSDMPSGAICSKCCQSIFLAASVMATVE